MSFKQDGTSAGSSPADAETTPLDVANAALGNEPGNEHETPASETPAEADANKDPAKEKWDPLSVVKKAVEDTKKSEGKSEVVADEQDPDKSSDPKDGQDPKGEAEDLGEITDEELKSYKPKTRKRIEGLLEDRQELTDRVANLEPMAEQYKVLTGYMQENNLGEAEFADLMVVGAMAKSQKPEDLEFAIGKTREFLTQLELAAGVRLPDDLQAKVDEGHLDAEAAKEVAGARITKQRAETTVEAVQTERTTEQTQTAVTNVHSAISDWQRQKFTTDPDYRTKETFLSDEMALLVSKEKGGRVLDRDRAVAIAEQAYANVTAKISKALPKPTPQSKTVLTSRNAPGNMASQPSSALEAARAGLKKK